MKIKCALLLIILVIAVAGCTKSNNITGRTTLAKDIRCSIEKPAETGSCGKVFGVYYDSAQDTCRTLNACLVDGEIPFKLSLDNPMETCNELCVDRHEKQLKARR